MQILLQALYRANETEKKHRSASPEESEKIWVHLRRFCFLFDFEEQSSVEINMNRQADGILTYTFIYCRMIDELTNCDNQILFCFIMGTEKHG